MVTQDEDIATANPYFHSPQREHLWRAVLLLYEDQVHWRRKRRGGLGKSPPLLGIACPSRAAPRDMAGEQWHQEPHPQTSTRDAEATSRPVSFKACSNPSRQHVRMCIMKAGVEHTVGSMIVQHDRCNDKHQNCCICLVWREGTLAVSWDIFVRAVPAEQSRHHDSIAYQTRQGILWSLCSFRQS